MWTAPAAPSADRQTMRSSSRHGAVAFCTSNPRETHASSMSETCHAQLFMTRCISPVHQQHPLSRRGIPNGILAQSPWLHRRGATMGGWWTTKQPWKGCAVVKPGEVGGRCRDAAERAQRPIDLHYHAIPPAGQGTRSIPRHNRLRGCGAPPTHTRGNAADGVTPGFGAEPLRGSVKGDHWTINYKRSRGVLRIENMGDPREWHIRNLPCATIYEVVYKNQSGAAILPLSRREGSAPLPCRSLPPYETPKRFFRHQACSTLKLETASRT